MLNISIIILSFVIIQRISELYISYKNTKILLSEGFLEFYPGHYPLIVAMHTTWLAALIFSVNEKAEINELLLFFYVALQFARYYIIGTLGKYWTTRIIRNPEKPLINNGIYKYIKHPNYLVVAFEIYLLPLVFDLWMQSLLFGTLNLFVLALRIYYENKVLLLSTQDNKNNF